MNRPIRNAARFAKKAIRSESITRDEPSLDSTRVTNAEAAAIGIAAEALPTIALRRAKQLAGRTLSVTHAWQQLIAARTALEAFQSRIDVKDVRHAHDTALAETLTGGGWWRLTRALPLVLLVAIDSAIFLFDAAFFVGLYRDLGDVPSSDWASPKALMSMAGGLATPLLVFGAAFALGHLLSTRRTWPDAKPNRVTFALTWLATALSVVLVVLFAWAAGFRFTAESSGPGSMDTPVALLATIFGLLPAAAALFHTLASNPLLVEHRRLARLQKENTTAEKGLGAAVQAGYENVEAARASLSDLIHNLLTEADVQISRAHQLVLLERARSGRAGNYTAFATKGPVGDVEPTLLLALPFPPRVVRLIEQAREALALSDPSKSNVLDRAVAERLRVLGIKPTMEGESEEPRDEEATSAASREVSVVEDSTDRVAA